MTCPINEQTADGIAVGRCDYYLPDGRTCSRHGDVAAEVETYLATGRLTLESQQAVPRSFPAGRAKGRPTT